MAKRITKIAQYSKALAQDTYIVKSLKQAKLLSDPLRLRILQEFIERPRTTMQVAESLGEKPSRLYRHVDALQGAGLLELKEERRKRGTTERYLQAIAHHFVIDPTLFLPGASSRQKIESREGMIESLIEMLRDELKQVYQRPHKRELHPMLLRAQVRGTTKEIKQLQQGLADWMEACHSLAKARQDQKPDPTKKTEEYAITIAFYPVVKKSLD